jgi:acetate---CoA ligase (ADP-forming)
VSSSRADTPPAAGTPPVHGADLQPLLAPRSIALVGASRSNAYASRLLANLAAGGFGGAIVLVNRRAEPIDGYPAFPSVEALPEPVDLAAVVVPQRAVIGVLEECAKRGVRAAVVISAGFAEAGDDGRRDEDAIRALAHRTGLLVCGPNCLGIANAAAPAMMHAYAGLRIPPGRLALVSQSGALAFASILSPAADREIGFSHVVSSGNEAVLDSVDFIRAFVRDPAPRVIASLIEGLKPGRGRRFLEVAEEAADAGKPLVVCKVGRSALGARQSVSHTGSMTGSDAVYDAAFAQSGVIRVPDPDDLFEVGAMFDRCPEPRGEGLAILSTSGGLGVLLADKCGARGLGLPALSPEISSALARSGHLLILGELGNPVDIRGQGAQHLPEILRLFIADDRYHILTVALGMPAVGERSARIARDLISVAAETDKPLMVLWTGTRRDAQGRSSDDDGFRLLERSAIPIFSTPDKHFRALEAMVAYHRFRRRRSRPRATPPPPAPAVDAAGARAFLAGTRGTLDELDSRRLLGFYGIAGPRETLVSNLDEAVSAGAIIGYPVVLKVVSADLPHKTEAGAVRLAIAGEDALRAAWTETMARVAAEHPAARVHGVLVQEMVTGAREMMVGVARDPQFGPVVTCGLGGVFVEVMQDVSRRVAPLAIEDARDLVASLRAAPILGAFRGRAPADVDALAEVLVRIARLALDLDDRIAEIDLNPLMVRDAGHGTVAVDALVVLRSEPQEVMA